MADATADTVPGDAPPEKKGSKLPLIIGLVLALAGGGGGFYAVQSGLLPFGKSSTAEDHEAASGDAEAEPPPLSEMAIDFSEIAFVPVEPIHLSLGHGQNASQLRFRAQLEVNAKYQSDVEKLLPRVADVLNSYLRAVEVSDLQDALALTRLRAQMLRRINIVTGQDRVRDLLIMEFVLN